MFGINSFEQVGDIVEGHIKELVRQENDLANKRLAICRKCPLYSDSLGGKCDNRKCFNTVENKLVNFPGKNVICGCGCRLQAKTRLANSKCVLGKW